MITYKTYGQSEKCTYATLPFITIIENGQDEYLGIKYCNAY